MSSVLLQYSVLALMGEKLKHACVVYMIPSASPTILTGAIIIFTKICYCYAIF